MTGTPIRTRPHDSASLTPGGSKLVESIHEVLVKCGIRDGMTLGFHHHFRKVTLWSTWSWRRSIKWESGISLACQLPGQAQATPLCPILRTAPLPISSHGRPGKGGEAISEGKLKACRHGPTAVWVRAIETGETVIDIAFIGAPTCDDYGNCRGLAAKATAACCPMPW